MPDIAQSLAGKVSTVPIVLTSRADSLDTKVVSCARGVLMVRGKPS